MESPEDAGLLDAILTSAQDYAILVISLDGKIATWNAGAEALFGYTREEIIGKPLGTLFTQDDREHGIPGKELETARRKGRAMDYRWHQRKDESCFWADGVMSPMYGSDGALAGFVKILRDATQKHQHEQEILRLARADPLTGLANRAEFAERFKDMTASAERHGQLLIVQLIDLDHFKQVNDRFGHQAGDEVLQQVALRLSEQVRDTDLVARLGGDEFVVLQPNAGSPEVGGILADKLIGTLAKPFAIDGKEMRIGASIGISVYPHDATDPDQLLRKADLALYKIKAETRNGYHYFSRELDQQAYRHSRDLAALRRALDNRQFSVHYQPKIEIATGQVVAVEALLRCGEPSLASYPIEKVIGLAREAGVMQVIGLATVEEACAQTRKWHEQDTPQLELWVNLCASEMADPNLPSAIGDALARCGLAPGHLTVELTERDIFDSGEQGLAILAAMREQGIQVAIDDFGTGYSSLSYLNDLPVDFIKLDRSFLRNIPESPQDGSVAAAIVSLAHGLRLGVVAEGVETRDQLDFCRANGFDLIQGFFVSQPLPADRMTRWLQERAGIDLLAPPLREGSVQPPQHPR